MRTLVLLITAAVGLHAQFVTVQPDCIAQFTFTTATTGSSYDNRNVGCTTWTITYMSTGFSAASLVVQTAPDATGVPGAWSTFTAASGSNPNTAVTQASATFSGYFPWVRANLTTKTGTGTIRGTLYGWRTGSSGSSGGGGLSEVEGPFERDTIPGTAIKPVIVAGLDRDGSTTVRPMQTDSAGAVVITPGGFSMAIRGAESVALTAAAEPVRVAGTGGDNGGAPGNGIVYQVTACDGSAAVTVTAGATTQIVALATGNRIRVCAFTVHMSAAGTFQWKSGTGASCGTSTANITGAIPAATNDGVSIGNGLGELFVTPVSHALCLTAVTGNAVGFISYALY